MQAANLSRLPKRHWLYYFGILLLPILIISILVCSVTRCDNDYDDGKGTTWNLTVVFGALAIGLIAGVIFGYAPQALRHKINVFSASTVHVDQYWNGCGTALHAMALTSVNAEWTTTTTTTMPLNMTYECSDDTNLVSGDTVGDVEHDAAADRTQFEISLRRILPPTFFVGRKVHAPLLLQEQPGAATDIQSCQDLCTNNVECFSMTFREEDEPYVGMLEDGASSGSGENIELVSPDGSKCKLYGKAATHDTIGLTESYAGTAHCVILERKAAEEDAREDAVYVQEITGLKYLGIIGGGIILVVLAHSYFNEKQRDFDVSSHMLVNLQSYDGGLARFASIIQGI